MKPSRRDLVCIDMIALEQSDWLFMTDRQYWVRIDIDLHYKVTNNFYFKKSTGEPQISVIYFEDTAHSQQVWKVVVLLNVDVLMCVGGEVGVGTDVLNLGVREVQMETTNQAHR